MTRPSKPEHWLHNPWARRHSAELLWLLPLVFVATVASIAVVA